MRNYDDQQALSDDRLHRLLQHYVELSAPDKEAWHERVQIAEDIKSDDLARFHGRLLAADWIELNLGSSPTAYRATAGGRRAVRNG